MPILRTSTLIILAVFFLAGCVVAPPAIDPRITIIEDDLAADLSILELSTHTTGGGFLEVQVTGMNKTPFYKKLEYKVEWLDQSGMIVPTILSRWTIFPAYGKAEFRFKSISPKTTVSDFRVLIRKGN